MTPLKDLLSKYKIEHSAIPSFNIDSFEIYQAVEAAVADTELPCLVQLSANEDSFIQAERLFMLVRKANADGLPLYLNMDHGQDLPRLLQLAKLGFDMVHFDGSKLEYTDNLIAATNFISQVKSINPDIIVEVEFNKINLVDKGVSSASYTSPDQAHEFMTKTHADLLAVSIGNLHGVKANLPEIIDLSRFQEIINQLPQTSFTLHGGSGIQPELVAAAIKMGIVKININTDLRLQFRHSLEKDLQTNQSEKIYDYFAPAIKDVQSIIKHKLLAFYRP